MKKMEELSHNELELLEDIIGFEAAVMEVVNLYRKRTGASLKEAIAFVRLRKAQMDANRILL